MTEQDIILELSLIIVGTFILPELGNDKFLQSLAQEGQLYQFTVCK